MFPKSKARRVGLLQSLSSVILVSLVLGQAKADSPRIHKIPLHGGLLHSSGLVTDAQVGGQSIRLQIDISQGSLVVPGAGCSTCRIGDNRYDVFKSATGGKPVSCSDERCAENACENERSSGGACDTCSSSDACCAPMLKSDKSSTNPLEGTPLCAFNMRFSDSSSGNGSMMIDTVELSGLKVPNVMFGAMHQESKTFEMPYVDGVLGMAYVGAACHPTCTPAVMDILTNETGISNIFTMCVNAHGGTLVLGAAEQSLATEPFAFIAMLDMPRSPHFLVPALGRGMVGSRHVDMPEVAAAVWSSATTSIAMGKVTFLTIMEALMSDYCDIPGLCSMSSWFRPRVCHHLEDEHLQAMPSLTFQLSDDISITLDPDDYLLPYKKIDGKLFRCVAIIVTDVLSKRNVGLLLGSIVMKKYAVAFDRANRRIGIAKAKPEQCGPKTGSDAGLAEASGTLTDPSQTDVVTANAPFDKASNDSVVSVSSDMKDAETCRAKTSCRDCAHDRRCAYRYTDAKCISLAQAGSRMFPVCSGIACACFIVGKSGWYFGFFCGVGLGIAILSVIYCFNRRKLQKTRYEEVNGLEDNEVETF